MCLQAMFPGYPKFSSFDQMKAHFMGVTSLATALTLSNSAFVSLPSWDLI